MPALNVRRKAALDHIADAVLSQEDATTTARAEAEQRSRTLADNRRQQLQQAREDVDRYSEIVQKMEAAWW